MTALRQLRALALATLLVACSVAALSGQATAATVGCGTATAQSQNGNQLYVAGTGPTCLRLAFKACRATALTINGHGVDTQLVLTFTVGKKSGACRVFVAGSNSVFFGSKTRKTSWTGICTGVTKRAEGVVLGGCSGGDYLLSPPGAPNVPNNRF